MTTKKEVKIRIIEKAIKENFRVNHSCNWTEVYGDEIRVFSENWVVGSSDYGMTIHHATLLIKDNSVEIKFARNNSNSRLRNILKKAAIEFRNTIKEYENGINLSSDIQKKRPLGIDFKPVSGKYFPLTATFQFFRADGTCQIVNA